MTSVDHRRRVCRIPLGSPVEVFDVTRRGGIIRGRLVGHLPGSTYCHVANAAGETLLCRKAETYPASR